MNRIIAIFCGAFLIVQNGCMTPRIPREQMLENARMLRSQADDLSPGKIFDARKHNLDACRIRVFKWDSNARVSDLVRQWDRPTFTRLRLKFEETTFPSSREQIARLPIATQETLKRTWIERVTMSLRDSTFDCDANTLSKALRNDGLVIYYFLVDRHNSAEMGHVDVVKLIITDTGGEIVARTAPHYSLDYPLGFIEKRDWDYDFLF